MKISYNWLCEYLPVKPEPQRLAEILTAVGLEVESLEKYEEVKGGLEGLVIGEVLEVVPHPNADKLRITRVDTGAGAPLKIVCGAPNVAAGQKVVVAPVGATIYPAGGEPLTMKTARIRGEESQGMICAEDEIGLGADHAGILVLGNGAAPGMAARDYFQPAEDWVYEIGLTPNRMDAMSHLGVARDVCAYLGNAENKRLEVRLPDTGSFSAAPAKDIPPISVRIENTDACPRYAGITLKDIKVAPSPGWLQQRLKSIGIRPVNNIVDITNFVLHESGQPLHAFDAAEIHGQEVIVRNLARGTSFITLDEKERTLHEEDLMICNSAGGMCLAGVFGGFQSGVKESTTRVFLESACFEAGSVRRSSFRHGLRTDAAQRFEKGVDISNLLFALKRAALLMAELAGGSPASALLDVYPDPQPRTEVTLSWEYLRKLSGKLYPPEKVQRILVSLGFEVLEQTEAQLRVAVPYSKPDISLPADVVEEIMRIDGYDNIAIPSHITLAPSLSEQPDRPAILEKTAGYLSANGFHEIFTNSITNSNYYKGAAGQEHLVHMLNSLSAELDVMRPSMLESGLESVAYNLNRRQPDLFFFEFGKTYRQEAPYRYEEREHLCLYLTGYKRPESWITQQEKTDSYFLKGHLVNILAQLGLSSLQLQPAEAPSLTAAQALLYGREAIGIFGRVAEEKLHRFDIRQEVWFADLDWNAIIRLSSNVQIRFTGIPRFPSVRRDLALILSKAVQFAEVERVALSVKSPILQEINLFDVFESDKLGTGRKSYAVSFTFRHPEKTLTDKEIDKVMQSLITALEKQLNAEIRK